MSGKIKPWRENDRKRHGKKIVPLCVSKYRKKIVPLSNSPLECEMDDFRDDDFISNKFPDV